MKKIIRSLVLGSVLGILVFPFVSSVACVVALPTDGGFVPPIQQVQLQIQGIATTNNGSLPIGTIINYSSRLSPTMACLGTTNGSFTVDKNGGNFGPISFSIPVNTTYLSFTIGSIPQTYLNGKIITGNQSLDFTITPAMAGTTMTQNLAFNAGITNPPAPAPLPPTLGNSTPTIAPNPTITTSTVTPTPTTVPAQTLPITNQVIYNQNPIIPPTTTNTLIPTIQPTLPLLSTSFNTSLKYGSRGDAVIELQDLLIAQGFLKGNSDGRYGLVTLNAVKAFQLANGLSPDGYFGKASRAKASSILADKLKSSNITEQNDTANTSSVSTVAGCTSTTTYSPTTGKICNSKK